MVATERHLAPFALAASWAEMTYLGHRGGGVPWGTLQVMAPRTLLGRRVVAAWRRLLHEEEGVALVLAIITMLVLTIALTTVMFMTAAGARDAHRSNAGQKASALAESGINNALAVLNANYPGTTIYPGDSTLLPTRTTTYPTGSVTWSGTLVNVPTNPTLEVAVAAHRAGQRQESDRAHRGGRRQDGDGRRSGRHPGQHVRASGHDGHRLDLRAQRRHLQPVRQRRRAGLRRPRHHPREHGDHLRDDPDVAHPARASEQDRGRAQPHAREPTEPGRPRQRLGRSGQRSGRDPRREPVLSRRTTRPPTPAPGGTPTRSGASSTTTSSRPATSRLRRSPVAAPIAWAAPADGASHPASPTSYMGFWYLNAGLGPKTPCATSSGTPPRFDTVSGIARQHDQPERLSGRQPVRSHRRRLVQLHVGGRPDQAGVGQGKLDPHDQGNRLHRRERARARPETRSTSARGRSSSAGSTRWTTTRSSA